MRELNASRQSLDCMSERGGELSSRREVSNLTPCLCERGSAVPCGCICICIWILHAAPPLSCQQGLLQAAIWWLQLPSSFFRARRSLKPAHRLV